MTLLHWEEARFRLGVLAMDQTHWEFVQLLNNLDQIPAERFPDLFLELLANPGTTADTAPAASQ